MKRNRHAEEQVITILKAYERGVSVAELARQNGVTEQTTWPQILSATPDRIGKVLSLCHILNSASKNVRRSKSASRKA